MAKINKSLKMRFVKPDDKLNAKLLRNLYRQVACAKDLCAIMGVDKRE